MTLFQQNVHFLFSSLLELRMLIDISRNTFRSHWKFKTGRSQSLAIFSPLHTLALHFTFPIVLFPLPLGHTYKVCCKQL